VELGRSKYLSCAFLAFGLGLAASAFCQTLTPDGRLPLPTDWSTKHLIYTGGFTAEQMQKMRNDPRLYYSWLMQGHAPKSPGATSGSAAAAATKPKQAPAPHRDWAFSLGGGTVAQNMFPAKYSFNAGSTTLTSANCTGDFAVYGLNVAGSSTQANLVALDNLYSGTSPTGLCGSAPTVLWAYNVTTESGGTVTTSPVLSENGEEVIFVESYSGGSILHVLRWNSSDGGTVGSPKTPTNKESGLSSCPATASCLVSITLGGSGHTITNSSPYLDYSGGIAYVGDDDGTLYKITNVLSTSTAPSVTSLTVSSGTMLTGPVYDSLSGYVFVGGHNGVLYAVTASSMALAKNPSIQVGYSGTCSSAANNQLSDAPIVDSTNGFVFEYTTTGTDNEHNQVMQAYTSSSYPSGNANYPGGTSWTAAATADVGEGDTSCNSNISKPTHAPAFDNAYYTSPSTGHVWVCGSENNSTTDYPELWNVAFSGTPALLGTVTGSTSYISATSEAQCSPVTEIYNGTTDFIFLGEGYTSFAYLYGFTISGTTATGISGSPITSYPDATAGTSGIIIDNIASQAQASSIYFTTLAKSTTVCGSTSAYCAVKLTQSGLQ